MNVMNGVHAFALIAAGSDKSDFADVTVPGWGWPALIGIISTLLLVDILVVHRRAHVIKLKEALIESIVWLQLWRVKMKLSSLLTTRPKARHRLPCSTWQQRWWLAPRVHEPVAGDA